MFKNLLTHKPKEDAKKINTIAKAEYLNIPIQLLAGFLDDTRTTIRNIYYYSLYAHFFKQEKGSDKEKYRLTCEWLNFQEVDREENLQRGRILFDRFTNSPMTGIDRNLYSEFNKLDKTDFDKACFLAFHALKSIVGSKTFQKTDNKFLWARMDGKAKSIQNESELSEKVRFFAQEYQTLKIKRELQENWGLIYYAQQTRGFYVSFKLDLKSLILEAVRRKRQVADKQRLEKLRDLEQEVFEKLEKRRGRSKSLKSKI
jgi:hypothetical protein